MGRQKNGKPGMVTVGYTLSQQQHDELEERAGEQARTKSGQTRHYVIRGLKGDRDNKPT